MLVALGQAVGAKSREQRAADLAAVSAAAAMRRVYPRLFEPAFLPPPRPGLAPVPNPRHLTLERYTAIARDAAVRGGARNGARVRPADVGFPGGGFAPTRVRVRVRAWHRARGPGIRDGRIEVAASAVAELAPDAAQPASPRAAATAGRSPTARASRCARTSRRRSTGWRPRPRQTASA